MASHDREVVLASAYRTPIGKFQGGLRDLNAVELASRLARRIVAKDDIETEDVDQVICGNVLSTGAGQNIARQIQINADLPMRGTAMTINQVCGSGLKAVRLAQSAVMLGDARMVLAGGAESMSTAPAYAPRIGKHDFDTDHWRDTLYDDGLNDAFEDYAMGVTAENLNSMFHLGREQLDRYALDSQRRAADAWNAGDFDDEVMPVNGLDHDEVMRPQSTMDALAALPPIYRKDGKVTAGNTSPVSDGASMVLVTTAGEARRQGLTPLARITGYCETGYRPGLMGYTPVLAIRKLLGDRDQQVSDIDLYEVNEAFASQAIVVQKELGIDEARYNVVGGALALGHPLGASGTRILTTLLHAMRRLDRRLGVAALCVGGGQAVAMEVERLA